MAYAAHGAGNLRDLGGLATADGRVVRDGTLLRSEAPQTLDELSRERLGAVPVKLIFDLRSDGEHNPPPALWAEGSEPEVVHAELFSMVDDDAGESGGMDIEAVLADESGAAAREFMHGYYRRLVDRFAGPLLADFAERVGVRGQTPVVVHCTAGQDRTGMLIALVLLALRVPREAVVADYMVTLEHFTLERVLGWFDDRLGPGDATRTTAVTPLSVAPEYLERALDLVLERCGSFDAYWHAAGVDAERLEAMRRALLI
ncbi:MAG TPA: tyrosine-protein phosphatase [Solirubrobacteraceae bacterium]|jgi:protein-tyrosine phosphatase|nr:tyrosine-protein phosphatase [Solirubrobacteraceae bacterium]